MRQITEIVIHCSATREGQPFSAADIDKWHRAQGWAGIGYHYVIKLDGTRETGRPIERAGSHVAGHNAGSIGICYIGGVAADGRTPKDTRTPAQKAELRKLVGELRGRFPNAAVKGHRDFPGVAKACPSFDVKAWLKEAGLDGRPAKPAERRVTASSLNVRSGPGTAHPVVRKLSKGALVAVLESEGGWARIDGGWASETYLEAA